MFMGYYFERLPAHTALALFIGVWFYYLAPQRVIRFACFKTYLL